MPEYLLIAWLGIGQMMDPQGSVYGQGTQGGGGATDSSSLLTDVADGSQGIMTDVADGGLQIEVDH